MAEKMTFQGFGLEDIDINSLAPMDYIFVKECDTEDSVIELFTEDEEYECEEYECEEHDCLEHDCYIMMGDKECESDKDSIDLEESLDEEELVEEEEDSFVVDDDVVEYEEDEFDSYDMFSICSSGDLKALVRVMDEDPSRACLITNECVEVACSRNDLDMLKYILSIDNIDEYYYLGDDDNAALRYSCCPVAPDVVKYLLSLDLEAGVNPSDNNYEGFIYLYEFEPRKRMEYTPVDVYYSHTSVLKSDKDLFLAFINHPLFYPSDGSDLPKEVKSIVDKYNTKFFKSTKKPKGCY